MQEEKSRSKKCPRGNCLEGNKSEVDCPAEVEGGEGSSGKMSYTHRCLLTHLASVLGTVLVAGTQVGVEELHFPSSLLAVPLLALLAGQHAKHYLL